MLQCNEPWGHDTKSSNIRKIVTITRRKNAWIPHMRYLISRTLRNSGDPLWLKTCLWLRLGDLQELSSAATKPPVNQLPLANMSAGKLSTQFFLQWSQIVATLQYPAWLSWLVRDIAHSTQKHTTQKSSLQGSLLWLHNAPVSWGRLGASSGAQRTTHSQWRAHCSLAGLAPPPHCIEHCQSYAPP